MPAPHHRVDLGRVQDVILVAGAVGVAVVALGAGVVGGLLQPHEYMFIWGKSVGVSGLPVCAEPPTSGLSEAHALLQTHLGAVAHHGDGGQSMDSEPGFQGSNLGSTTPS